MFHLPGFRIFIKTPTDKVITLDAVASDTIGNIKAIIQDKAQIPIDQQQLVFAGTILQDETTLSDCNILEDSFLYLMIKSKGLRNWMMLKVLLT